ncbi:MAG: energy-coupling factor transporter transmembrane protein EcfT [Treponema sp.]|nr:energy-coupling factor transporter transmembrane protein EcfT [Treponema sp.]
MVRKITLFSYTYGSSVLHRLDARIKLLFIFLAGYGAFYLPPAACTVCIAAVFITAAASGFTFKDQLIQLKPAVYYVLLLYTVSLISSYTGHTPFPLVFIPRTADILLSLRLVLAVLVTGLLYRTTSPLALRTALEQIEDACRRFFHLRSPDYRKIPPFSEIFSLLLVFIPQVFDVWEEVHRAWKARNGRNGIRMLSVLFPVFISVCMKRSYLTSLALRNRHR